MALSVQSYSKNFMVWFLAIAFLFSQTTSLSQKFDKPTQDLIDQVCRQTEDNGFCNKVFLGSIPIPSADIVGLARVTIIQALSNATNTHNFIVQLSRNETLGPAEKNALAVCENGYRIVMESFQSAIAEFEQKHYKAVADYARDTPRAQGSCATVFATPPEPANPLNERNREMRIIISMAVICSILLNR